MLRDENCIFCKILDGVIPSVKIREDDDFVAILDAFPNRKGMTLVITKDHMDSDILAKDDDFIAKYFQAAKKVANMLKK
jgi:histidine triad (HIT) family protein